MFSQTDKLFAAILLAFIVYITVRGELPSYASLFVAAPHHDNSSSGSGLPNPFGGASSSGGNPISNVIGNSLGEQLGSALASFFGGGSTAVAGASQAGASAAAFFAI